MKLNGKDEMQILLITKSKQDMCCNFGVKKMGNVLKGETFLKLYNTMNTSEQHRYLKKCGENVCVGVILIKRRLDSEGNLNLNTQGI